MRGAEPVQRLDHEVGVPQPAVAVVPVARRAGRLGDRGRAATIAPVSSKLHSLSVIAARMTSDCQSSGMPSPRTHSVQKSRVRSRNSRETVSTCLERLVRAEDERDRMRQHEAVSRARCRRATVGGQPHGLGAAGVADMVGPERPARAGLAVVEGRPNAHGDARQPSSGSMRRYSCAGWNVLEGETAARSRVHGVAAGVLERGLQHRGVAHIARDRDRLAVEQDVAEALLLVAGEQAREHRVAVEAREAPPHDAPARVGQRRDAAIADRGEIERFVAERLTGRAIGSSL